jgi:hypothetical protein
MGYLRLFADRDGQSRYEDVKAALTPTALAPPAPPLGLSPLMPAARWRFLGAPAGWRSDFHPSA